MSNDGFEIFTFPEYSTSFLKQLDLNRKQKHLTDVTLCAGQEEFHCHKLVLISSSPYFDAMFSAPFKEQITSRVELDVMSPWALGRILDFVYSGNLYLSINTVQDIFQAATLLQYPQIVDACVKFMSNNLNVSNCLGLRSLAKRFGFDQLAKDSFRIATENFQNLIKMSSEWLSLPFDQVKELLDCDDIEIRHEHIALEALFDWVNHNFENRITDFERLIECIRIEYISLPQLNSDLKSVRLLKECKRAREIFLKCMETRRSGKLEMKAKLPRPATLKRDSLVVVGGMDSDISNAVYYLSPNKKSWMPCTSLPSSDLTWFSACVLCNHIVVSGGVKAGRIVSDVWIYSPELDRWKKAAPMLHPRAKHSSFALDTGHLFVMGGLTISPPQATSPRRLSNDFPSSGSLDESNYNLRRTSSAEHRSSVLPLFIAGGSNDEYLRPRIHLEKSIDRYDLSEDKWEEAGTCQMVRQEASVACVSASSTQPRSSSLACCLSPPCGTGTERIQSVQEECEDHNCLSTPSSASTESRSRSICLSESTNWPNLRKIRTMACEWTVVELGGMSEPSPEETDRVRFLGLDQITMYRVSEDLTVHSTEQFIKLPCPIRFAKCILREDTGLVYIFTETDSKLSVLDLKRNSLRPLNSLGEEPCEGAARISSNARIHCGASWIEDRLYIYGGFSELIGPEQRPANARDDLSCFNPSTNVWSRVNTRNSIPPRALCGCLCLDM